MRDLQGLGKTITGLALISKTRGTLPTPPLDPSGTAVKCMWVKDPTGRPAAFYTGAPSPPINPPSQSVRDACLTHHVVGCLCLGVFREALIWVKHEPLLRIHLAARFAIFLFFYLFLYLSFPFPFLFAFFFFFGCLFVS